LIEGRYKNATSEPMLSHG